MSAYKIYIGYDRAEKAAYEVAAASCQRHAAHAISVTPVHFERLRDTGFLRRPRDDRKGDKFDLISGAPASTDFALSRFLVPFMAHSGWALFTDSDVLFMADVEELFDLADDQYAVMCVKHEYVPAEGLKMGGAVQSAYPHKNWSSVMLWNCEHPANLRLSLHDVQSRRGAELHGLYWLHESEIGELPPEWNWLVGVQERPAHLKLAHFTLGGPFTPGWAGALHDELWTREWQQLKGRKHATTIAYSAA